MIFYSVVLTFLPNFVIPELYQQQFFPHWWVSWLHGCMGHRLSWHSLNLMSPGFPDKKTSELRAKAVQSFPWFSHTKWLENCNIKNGITASCGMSARVGVSSFIHVTTYMIMTTTLSEEFFVLWYSEVHITDIKYYYTSLKISQAHATCLSSCTRMLVSKKKNNFYPSFWSSRSIIDLMQIWRPLISISWISSTKEMNPGMGRLTTIYLSLIFRFFKCLPFHECAGLKFGCITNFYTLFLIMGFISLVDEIQFMPISSLFWITDWVIDQFNVI